MRPRKLLVTGGTGFFGKALIKYWIKNADEKLDITILSRNPSLFLRDNKLDLNKANIKLIAGDVLNFDSLPHSNKYSHVLHAATESTSGLDLGTLERYEQIVRGTRNILELSVKTGVEKILVTSSGAVYGKMLEHENGFEESNLTMPDVLDPESAYGIGKRVSEHLCAQYKTTYGLDFVIARCFAFVGEDLPMSAHFAIGNFIKSCARGEKIVIKGAGREYRSYLYQEDLAVWLDQILMSGKSGQAYNVGSDYRITIADLARLVAKIINPNTPIEILGKESGNVKLNYFPNINRAKQELNLEIYHDLEKAIKKTYEGIR